MWGFGSVRFVSFVRLARQLVALAWRATRRVSKGETIEVTLTFEVE